MAAGEWKNSFGFVFLLILVRVGGVHAIVHVAGWISQPPWLLKVALGWETEIPGIWDSPYFKLEGENFEAKSGGDLGLRVCAEGGMPKIAIGITAKYWVAVTVLKNPLRTLILRTGKNKNSNGSVHSIGIPVRPKPYPRKVLNLSF